MRIFFQWICFLILPYLLVNCQPLQNHDDRGLAEETIERGNYNAQSIPKLDNAPKLQQEQIISVRITSSVAVGRSRAKSNKIPDNYNSNANNSAMISTVANYPKESTYTTAMAEISTATDDDSENITDIPPSLVGANIEYIKQLQAKKGTRGVNNFEQIHSFINTQEGNDSQYNNIVADSTVPTTLETDNDNYDTVTTENVPIARSVPLSYSSKNYVHDLVHKALEEHHNPRLTTVSFDVIHDTPQRTYSEHNSNGYMNSNPASSLIQRPTFNDNAPQLYSQPSKIYSEPAKFYSEPAKIYSEPAKIYSEPAKIYSEPAKIYSEPAKFYSQPASLHLPPDTPPSEKPWIRNSEIPNISTTPLTTNTNSAYAVNTNRMVEHQPEKNYEVDEKVSVMTDGRTHGVQPSDPENCKQEKCKVGYVVEGRQFRKYRVEERTSDGFIVGEYGVVRNEDGALRGVRYTADSEASPRLIHDALMKFLQLK